MGTKDITAADDLYCGPGTPVVVVGGPVTIEGTVSIDDAQWQALCDKFENLAENIAEALAELALGDISVNVNSAPIPIPICLNGCDEGFACYTKTAEGMTLVGYIDDSGFTKTTALPLGASIGKCPVPERGCVIYVDPDTFIVAPGGQSGPFCVDYVMDGFNQPKILNWFAPGMEIALGPLEPPTPPEGSILVGCSMAKDGKPTMACICVAADTPAAVDGSITLLEGTYCSVRVDVPAGCPAPVVITENGVEVTINPGQSWERCGEYCCPLVQTEIIVPEGDAQVTVQTIIEVECVEAE